jgi:hypothetical protein
VGHGYYGRRSGVLDSFRIGLAVTTADGEGHTRFEFRDTASSSVALDGAWWPTTRDGAVELAALIQTLDTRQTRLRLLMLNPYGWNDHPRRVQLADRTVRIEWITTIDRSVVIGATVAGGRIDLHLALPEDKPIVDGPIASAVVAAPPKVAPVRTAERSAMGTATLDVAKALDGFGTESPPVWAGHVRLALRVLREDLRRYHSVVHRSASTYDRVVDAAPRLSGAIANLEREHLRIGASLDRLLRWSETPRTSAQYTLLHTEGLALVRSLDRYRQLGADLLHQADAVDLGGQG